MGIPYLWKLSKGMGRTGLLMQGLAHQEFDRRVTNLGLMGPQQEKLL